MLILEYISMHATPSGALRECQPGSPRIAYRRMSNHVHHAQACVGSTPRERGPIQLAEHSSDAAGIVPAVADVPGRETLHHHLSLSICLSICRSNSL